jgi:hypothetical protein
MKRYILSIVLMTMFVSTAAFSQEPEPEDIEQELHLRNMQLELEERESELGFQERMRELELEARRIQLEREQKPQEHLRHRKHHGNKGGMVPFILVCIVVHLLVAIWVYKDIRERNSGSGIWIVIALLAGLFGVLAYAIVRLGDIRRTK